MSHDPLVALGQLMAAAFACGLNLYATLAVVGLAAALELATLPTPLRGLEQPLVIGTAALLYALEFTVDKIRYLDSAWDAVHTFIRPPAAALLAAAALAGSAIELRLAGACLAGAIAFGAHGAKAGLRLILNTERTGTWRSALSVLEDALAIGLAVVALRYPAAALPVAAGVLLLLLLAAPRFWRAFLLGLHAMSARVRSVFGERQWHALDELPRSLRALVEPAEPGTAEPRALRAALKGCRSVAAYRHGWLVLRPGRTLFLYHALARPRLLQLPAIRAAHLSTGLLTDRVELELDGARCTLFLLKDGPPPELALADLVPAGA